MGKEIALDLGAGMLRAYVRGKGIVLREPAVAAIKREDGSLSEIGNAALRQIMQLPGLYNECYPLEAPLFDRLEMTELIISRVLRKIGAPRAKVIMTVPSGYSDEEQNTLAELVEDAGARKVYLVDETVAAVMGSGVDVFLPTGTPILHIGASRAVVGMVSLGTLVQYRSIDVGGSQINRALGEYLQSKYKMNVLGSTLELLKIGYGGGLRRKELTNVALDGCSFRTGLLRRETVTSDELADAMEDSVTQIVQMLCDFLEEIHTEYNTDLNRYGLLLTGGGAEIYGLPEILREMTGLRITVANNPDQCAILGAAKFYEKLPQLQGELNLTKSTVIAY